MEWDVTLLGCGWEADDLTLRGARALREARRLVLQTERLGCARWLGEQGIAYETLDQFYERAEDFDEFVTLSTEFLLERAQEGPLTYAASELSDRVAASLSARVPARLIPGAQTGGELAAFAGSGMRVVSAADCEGFVPQANVPTLVRELDSPLYASEIKLVLMNCYPEEQDIRVLQADGRIVKARLCDLDRLSQYDHRVCALIPAVGDLTALERFDFDCLQRIVRRLRAFDGCLWDREQTHESLRPFLIEEAYEAVDAVNREDSDALCDELGDVLLQVALHAEIGREHGEFDATDVATAVCRKMIRRHPHVFAGRTVENLQDEWDRIKREEKGGLSPVDSMREVARALPALTRARKVLARAARAGLCINDLPGAMDRLDESIRALKQALSSGKPADACAAEALFHLVNLLRIGQTDPEMLLSEEIDRALEQFARTDAAARKNINQTNQSWEESSHDEG